MKFGIFEQDELDSDDDEPLLLTLQRISPFKEKPTKVADRSLNDEWMRVSGGSGGDGSTDLQRIMSKLLLTPPPPTHKSRAPKKTFDKTSPIVKSPLVPSPATAEYDKLMLSLRQKSTLKLAAMKSTEAQRMAQIEQRLDARQQHQRQLLSSTLKEAMEMEAEAERKQREALRWKQEKLELERKRIEHEQENLKTQEQRRLKDQENAAKLLEDELESARIAALEKARLEAAEEVGNNYGDPDALQQSQQYLDVLLNAKALNAQVKQNREMATEALKYRMKFTTKLGAVTNSRKHILQFIKEINLSLSEGRMKSPMLYGWLLNNLAKQFVKQAENEVSVNMKKAFPLAALCALLFTQHPELITFVMGKLVKKCPYVVPQYAKREPGETEDQMRTKLAYKKPDGDAYETEHQYQERMKGMLAFYLAIAQTDLTPYSLSSAYPPAHLWQWLSRILNMTARKITPGLVETFLSIAGHVFVKVYGRQADKIIQFIHNDFMARMQGQAFEGAKVRLGLALDVYHNGQIPAHEGSQFRP